MSITHEKAMLIVLAYRDHIFDMKHWGVMYDAQYNTNPPPAKRIVMADKTPHIFDILLEEYDGKYTELICIFNGDEYKFVIGGQEIADLRILKNGQLRFRKKDIILDVIE